MGASETRRVLSHSSRSVPTKHGLPVPPPERPAALRQNNSTSQAVERTRRQRLLQLVSLVRVRHRQSVQVLAAANLELGRALRLLDLDG